MQKIIYLSVLFFYLFPLSILSQIHPMEGAKLNYRIIGFSFPETVKSMIYTIEIASGNYTTETPFKQNLISTTIAKTNKIVIEVPSFSTSYTWRVRSDKNRWNDTIFHHFSTLMSNNADTSNYRFAIEQQASEFQDAFVFNDGNKVLYNMHGEPVWFLPNIKGVVDDYSVIRDLKITLQNTITFLTFNMAYEISYDGEILWAAPNNGKVSGGENEHYHHELTRLTNGHYMILGHEALPWKWEYDKHGDSMIVMINKSKNSSRETTTIAQKNLAGNAPTGISKRAEMGTIIEYNEQGKVIWSWKSSTFYKGEKLKMLKGSMGFKDSHENAFFFDEKSKIIYVSFKNTNQILKIQYPEGTVMRVFDGTITKNGIKTSIFSEQHACKVSPKGEIYIYNNNIANQYSLPNVTILQEPAFRGDYYKAIWSHEYPDENNNIKREPLTSGGNVIPLQDGSIFVSSCVPYAHVYIITREKEFLWDASLEKWNAMEHIWKPFPQYRASIITTRKKMEDMIWRSASRQQ